MLAEFPVCMRMRQHLGGSLESLSWHQSLECRDAVDVAIRDRYTACLCQERHFLGHAVPYQTRKKGQALVGNTSISPEQRLESNLVRLRLEEEREKERQSERERERGSKKQADYGRVVQESERGNIRVD